MFEDIISTARTVEGFADRIETLACLEAVGSPNVPALKALANDLLDLGFYADELTGIFCNDSPYWEDFAGDFVDLKCRAGFRGDRDEMILWLTLKCWQRERAGGGSRALHDWWLGLTLHTDWWKAENNEELGIDEMLDARHTLEEPPNMWVKEHERAQFVRITFERWSYLNRKRLARLPSSTLWQPL